MKKTLFISPIIFVLLPLFTYATSGACSDHGGVDCAAGAQPNGNVICNDGWTDSSVAYSSMQECSQGTEAYQCTQAEANQLNIKYGVPEKEQKMQELNTQLDALTQQTLTQTNTTDSQTLNNNAIESLQLESEVNTAGANLQTALTQAENDCLALGAAEYAQQQASLTTQELQQQSQPVQTTTPPPLSSVSKECLSPNSHYTSSTQCACDDGYFDINGYCATIAQYCTLTLYGNAIPTSATTCGCPTGYAIGTEVTRGGASITTCVAVDQPSANVATESSSIARAPATSVPTGGIANLLATAKGISAPTTSVATATTTQSASSSTPAAAPKQKHWYEWLNPLNWFSWIH